jgi:hypothetical protein
MLKKITIVGSLLIIVGSVGFAFTWKQLSFAYDDVSFEHLSQVTHQIPFEKEELSQLKINIGDYDVSIKQEITSSDKNYIEIQGKVPASIELVLQQLKISDQSLIFDVPVDPGTVEIKSWYWIFVKNYWNRPSLTITIYSRELINLDVIDIQLSSGQLSLEDLTAKRFVVNHGYGDFKMRKLEANQIRIIKNQGDVEGSQIKGSLKANMLYGDIELSRFDGPTYIDVYFGDVELQPLTVHPLEVKASTGDIEIIPATDFKGFYDVQAKLGEIQLTQPLQQTTDVIKVRTDYGDIEIH